MRRHDAAAQCDGAGGRGDGAEPGADRTFAPRLAPYDPTRAVATTYGDPGRPSAAFPLGTDELGRDVLSRIIWGARVSLIVGVAAMVITMTIGVAIGVISGFFGGAADFALMRFTDVMLTLPALLLAMAFVAVLHPSLLNVLLVIGLVSRTQIARVVRAETLSMAERDFVTAARALGGSPARLIALHVLPNVMPIIVVMAVLGTSGTLLLDAGLSFLSLGVPPPTPSWGRMIEEALIDFRTAPWLIAFPGWRFFTRCWRLICSATATCARAAGRPGDEAAARHAPPAHRRLRCPSRRRPRPARARCSAARGERAGRALAAAALWLAAASGAALGGAGCRGGREPRRCRAFARRAGAPSRRTGRRADARPGRRLRHRLVDLRADDFRHPGALQRRRRRPGARDRDELGGILRRTGLHVSPAPRRSLHQRPCGDRRRLQVRNRARAQSGDALERDGIFSRDSGSGGISGRSCAPGKGYSYA